MNGTLFNNRTYGPICGGASVSVLCADGVDLAGNDHTGGSNINACARFHGNTVVANAAARRTIEMVGRVRGVSTLRNSDDLGGWLSAMDTQGVALHG